MRSSTSSAVSRRGSRSRSRSSWARNVLLRYGFSLGSIWAQELEWHLMAPICLFGMSYALRHGEHVRVDVLFASILAAHQAAR